MGKIGIVTFNNANNFGAFLQEYALQKFLLNAGLDAEVINYQKVEFDQQYIYRDSFLKTKYWKRRVRILRDLIFKRKILFQKKTREKMFEQCRSIEIIGSRGLKKKELKNIVNNYSCFIAGSDQVWNLKLTNYDLTYFLDFVPDSQSFKKISYGASLGNTNMSDEDKILIKGLLKDFRYISVRERTGQSFLMEGCGIYSDVVVDPTFLINKKAWISFAKKATKPLPRDRYVFVYTVAKQENLYEKAIKYADHHNLKIIFVGGRDPIRINGQIFYPLIDIGPYEFVNLINNAEIIFTTSFHGIAISINLEKDFFYELNKKVNANASRIVDLITNFDIKGREINEKEETLNWNHVRKRIDFESSLSGNRLLEYISNI